MPNDQIAVMTPFVAELAEALSENSELCMTFSANTNDAAWVQVCKNMVNISMAGGRYSKNKVEAIFIEAGFYPEVIEYEKDVYLTLNLAWINNQNVLCQVLDTLFISHLGQQENYEIDAEMYEMLDVADDIPALLPNISDLRRVTQSLAMLDAILSPEWEYRYYSFDSHWGEGEELASMRNGCGDDWFLLFDANGAALKGFAHELAEDESFYKDMQSQLPAVFSSFMNEPAFSMQDATFCYWRQKEESSWSKVRSNLNDDGAVDLLDLLVAGPEAYKEWAEAYYEVDVALKTVKAVFAHKPLTDALILTLNPEVDLSAVYAEAREIAYPYLLKNKVR